MNGNILEIRGLRKRYPLYGPLGRLLPPIGFADALSGVSLTLREGEIYGLVGESGCGKTTTGRAVVGLVRPDGGEIIYAGRDLAKLSRQEFAPLRRDIQMVFQDSLSSLNPRQTIGELLEEPLMIHGIGNARERRAEVSEMLMRVGLTEEHRHRRPHELSGGQAQRVGIARALIIRPKIVVCDEPVSALDVSIQAQILNMLTDLRRETGISILFISHDICVVRCIADRVGVMYGGKIAEEAETETLFASHTHPYTARLLDSVPR